MNGTAAARVDTEVEAKLDRLRRHLADNGRDGVLLTTQPNVAWVLGGREHWVSRSMPRSFAWVYVSAERFAVLALSNEEARLREELQVEQLGAELLTAPWWSSLEELAGRVAGERVLTDAGPGEVAPTEIQRLRLALTEHERARLRLLGRDACEAVESILMDLGAGELPSLSERELAARVVGALERRGTVVGGIMVGGHERRLRFRHPVVTDAALGADVLIVVVAVRGGLNVALSRTVSAGPAAPELLEHHAVACRVEAAMVAASVPGATWTEALEAGLAAYAHAGLADEWQAHTQGGPIGYGPREYIAYPASAGVPAVQPQVLEHQAFAWNPTALGAKSEDTFIVEGSRAVPVTNSVGWPSLTCEAGGQRIARPVVLELST